MYGKFPVPRRPVPYDLEENIALSEQIAGIHKILMAPLKVRIFMFMYVYTCCLIFSTLQKKTASVSPLISLNVLKSFNYNNRRCSHLIFLL